jgi:hypothetical protein
MTPNPETQSFLIQKRQQPKSFTAAMAISDAIDDMTILEESKVGHAKNATGRSCTPKGTLSRSQQSPITMF